jgi:hypothetical protein
VRGFPRRSLPHLTPPTRLLLPTVLIRSTPSRGRRGTNQRPSLTRQMTVRGGSSWASVAFITRYMYGNKKLMKDHEDLSEPKALAFNAANQKRD